VRYRTLLILGFLLVSGGCAAASVATVDGPTRHRNLITGEEVQAQEQHHTAYEVVQGLRPTWLHNRSSGTMNAPEAGSPVVYMDDIRLGGLEALRRIPRSAVVSVEYYSPSDATTRFGTGHMGGAIVVRGRRG
jgi:hypothetical protein